MLIESTIKQSISEKYGQFLEKSPVSQEYAKVYNEFGKQYSEKIDNEISSIRNGSLRLYATEQITNFKDFSEEFKQIKNAFRAFKRICDKPLSHLKEINEVRPIETIKRIGYEAIPYLATHSEDWLARTVNGLQPLRLFSRVEEDDFQIYENRVVKTLIDLLISFLRKVERQLQYQKEQLSSIRTNIIDSKCQTGSLGFDKNFSIAILELISESNYENILYPKYLDPLKKLHDTSLELLKKYRTLRNTKLYQYLKKAKAVQNPLNETNVLLMDKNYSVIYKLWKKIHRNFISKSIKSELRIAKDKLSLYYQQFVAVLCGYATHVLNFNIIQDGYYKRDADNIEILIAKLENGNIRVTLIDRKKVTVPIKNGMIIPINPNTSYEDIEFDGKNLIFPSDITYEKIENFCSLLKPQSNTEDMKDKKRERYRDLKQLMIDEKERYKDVRTSFIIIPVFAELSPESKSLFDYSIKDIINKYFDQDKDDEVVIALPLCNEYEQKVIQYAQKEHSNISILPITIFDINSFRRIQNILYKHILKFHKGKCLVCGDSLHKKGENQEICYNEDCNNLILTRTKCPECKEEYYYLNYENIPPEIIERMQQVKPKDFFQWDSLYQYKNIVPMIVENSKIRPICPHCSQS